MRKFQLLLCLVVLVGIAFAQDTDAQDTEPDTAETVVIEVGEDTMSLTEFDERFLLTARNIAAQQGMGLTDDMLGQLIGLRPNYLDQLATEMVLLNEAEARGLTLSDEEVDAQLQTIIEGFETQEEYETLLSEAGFESEDQLRRLIRENESIRLVVEDIQSNVELSDEDIQAFYEENQAEFQQPEQACTRHILLESEEDALDVISELEGGAEFAAVAEERSTGPSAPQGGDLGCITPGQTVPAFNDAAFSAEVGEVVGPVETQFGFHVLTVYERNDASVRPLEEVEAPIREQLSGERVDEAIQVLRDDAGVEVYPDRLGEFNVPETAAPEEAPEETPEEAPEAPAEDTTEDSMQDSEEGSSEEPAEENSEESGEESGEAGEDMDTEEDTEEDTGNEDTGNEDTGN
jgi:peptidyl-prolyl cis-trans isomerase C